MYLIYVLENELDELDKFCKSWYYVISDFRERHKVNVQRYEVVVNDIEYDFYYIPFEITIKTILSDSLIMRYFFEWHISMHLEKVY